MFSKLLDVLNDLQPRQILMLAASTAMLIFVVVYLALSVLSEKEPVSVAPPAPQVATRSVVVARDDIPPHTVWYGNPIRQKGYMTKSGILLDMDYKDKDGVKHNLED